MWKRSIFNVCEQKIFILLLELPAWRWTLSLTVEFSCEQFILYFLQALSCWKNKWEIVSAKLIVMRIIYYANNNTNNNDDDDDDNIYNNNNNNNNNDKKDN